MFEPRKWWSGALVLVPVWVIANVVTGPAVESDIKARSEANLPRQGLEAAAVSVAGRDVTLTGTPFDPATGATAAADISALDGVRLVNTDFAALPDAKPYLFSAALAGGTLRLTGDVPDAATRAALVAAAGKANPGAKIVDAMTYASGAPPHFGALAGAASAALADLNPGTASLKDQALTLAGTASTVASYQHALAGLQHLEGGMTLADANVIPPEVKNFSFVADKSADGITLSGDVPGEAARVAVVKAAQAADAGAPVTDHLVPASGAPAKLDFAAASGFALGQLGELSRGHAVISASGLDISGDAATTANALKVKTALGGALPGGLVAGTIAVRDLQAMTDAQKAAAEKAAAEQAAAEKAAADKAAADKAAAEKAAADKAAAEQAAAEKAAADKAAADKAAAEKAAAEQAAADKAAADKAAALAAPKAAAAPAPTPEAAAATQCQADFSGLLAKDKVHFAVARADILPASKPLLDQLAIVANKCATTQIAINGYTDSDGNASINVSLSQKRAQAVVDYLTKAGVAASRLEAHGFGDADPVAPNDNAADKAKNRRIEFKVRP